MGVLTTSTLEQVWNSARYVALRKTLVEHQLFPVCRRCCKVELSPTPAPQPVRVLTTRPATTAEPAAVGPVK